MNLCAYSHPEICHEERNCPICEVITDKEKQIEELRDALREAETKIENLKQELETQ